MKVNLWCYSLVDADERVKSFLYEMDGHSHVYTDHTQHKHYLANILDLLDS